MTENYNFKKTNYGGAFNPTQANEQQKRITSNDRPSPRYNGVQNEKPKIGVASKKTEKSHNNQNNPEEKMRVMLKQQ